MKKEHIKYLACPACKEDLALSAIEKAANDVIEDGTLNCTLCGKQYKITRFIPRFVSSDNYASGFGLEWTKHAKTQYDSYSGINISETRFFEETKWPRKLDGETILEVGSGSGRFTEQACSTGGMVVSMDYSYAVDSNYASNGDKDNLLIVQGDIYNMPFKEKFFDKLFCIGVLQHTPDVKKSFMALPRYLKSGGHLAVDVYPLTTPGIKGLLARFLSTKKLARFFTRRVDPSKLYGLCKGYIEFMWPLARWINKIPKIGKKLNWMLLIADYRGVYPLSENILKEWAILDTFDLLSPKYDYPQTIETLQEWFRQANFRNIEINYGYNGIEGRGINP